MPSLTVRLPSDRRAPWVARRSISCLEGFVLPSALEDANLLVTELVTNAVLHGDLSDDEPIEIEAQPSTRGLRVEVATPGARELSDPVQGRSPGSGWGLMLVAKLASRWGVETDKSTAIWFEIDLRKGPDA